MNDADSGLPNIGPWTEIALVRNFDLEFQIMTRLLVADRAEQRYGWSIGRWLRERQGISLPQASVYRVLGRMQNEGWVTSDLGDPAESYAGGPRNYFTLTSAGHSAYIRMKREMLRVANRVIETVREEEASRGELGEVSRG